ncbi:MAG TPA: type I-C CRISPR-associated protein Cas8c/Csd1 [Anaerolineales bacterium]|nr:type I-C CRISPR-associated protein Cas8c/Csd1 [Anaerolineales bacterium]HLO29912.1 type I-C CRISPR-associated protein Cas8c/Csd1 [Anaerolineales bacterium]
MILQALTRYYDILSHDPESDIAPPGYSSTGVSFALNISEQGKLLDVIPFFEQVPRGKKLEERPRRMIVPEQVKKTSGISANFLCENSAYILGISDKGDTEYSQKRFEEFVRFNKELLAKANSKAARATIAFLDNYKPEEGREHPQISPYLETILKGGNIVFIFDGSLVHEDPAIRQVWEVHKSGSDALLIRCLVTGETAPLARLHPSLKGIRGANPTGTTLVGFNARAYESYNREQGMNSPVSEKAAFAYATALNYLLSSTNENKKFVIGDTTIVYWAESEKKEYAKAFLGLCEPETVEMPIEESQPIQDKKADKRLKKVAEKVRRVQALDVKKLLEGLDENPRFYVLGLAPNAARVSVRFFHSDPFDKIVEKIMKHYADLEIVKEFEDQPTYLTIQHIVNETISKKASDPEASPLMAGSVFRAVLENAPYPAALYNAIITRIRADQDDPKKFIRKINYERAAIIKAYLLRKYRNQPQHPIQEVLVMSLNEQSTVPAYVLGRLFAVLEKVQQEAVGDVNASIKDRYFTSACASPASVFPILLRLSQHHISKVGAYYHDKRIENILNLLDIQNNPIPAHLSLDDQGAFVLGYYHQRKDLWTAKTKNSVEITETK